MNTPQEQQIISELEEGAFNISAVELINAEIITSGRRLPKPIIITLPANTHKYTLEDFANQVLGQQDGLNFLTIYDFLTNFENRHNNGRDSNSSFAQEKYRQAAIEIIAEDYMSEDPELSYEEAKNDAASYMRPHAALHNPDLIIGGAGYSVTGAGIRNVNSALGALWRHGRAQELYNQIREACSGWSEEEMKNTYLNVRLQIEDKFG